MAKISTFGSMTVDEGATGAESQVQDPAPASGADPGEIIIPDGLGGGPDPGAGADPEAGADPAPGGDPAPAGDPEPPANPNESSFELNGFDDEDEAAPAGQQAPPAQQQSASWQDVIANVNQEELLKHLGVDEFVINMHKHISNGGKASDYIEARGRDWNEVPDIDIMRMEYAAKYPNLSEVEIDRLLTKKYGEEDLDEDGQIELKADAYMARQRRIEEDKKFQIVDRPAQQQNNSAEVEAAIQEQLRYFAEHEATKTLSQSKRVAVDLGDGQSFNFNIDKPEVLTRAITDPVIWQKITSNERGEPNVALLHQVALFAINPTKFVKDLVNYGKSLGHLREIEEGRNAVPPKGAPPRAGAEKQTGYSIGTYGRRSG